MAIILVVDFPRLVRGQVKEGQTGKKYTKQIKPRALPLNILYGAAGSFEGLKFNVLRRYYPQLKSKRGFMISLDYAVNVTLVIESNSENLTAGDFFQATQKALGKIVKHVVGIT